MVRREGSFCLQWVLASAVGGAVAGLLTSTPSGGLLVPAAFAIPQWLVLRRVIGRAVLWIPATFLGGFLGVVLAYLWIAWLTRFTPDSQFAVYGVWGLGAPMIGGVVGLVQQPALRCKLSHGLLWAAASGLALSLCTLTYWQVDLPHRENLASQLLHQVSKMSVVGLTYGLVTGAALARIGTGNRPSILFGKIKG